MFISKCTYYNRHNQVLSILETSYYCLSYVFCFTFSHYQLIHPLHSHVCRWTLCSKSWLILRFWLDFFSVITRDFPFHSTRQSLCIMLIIYLCIFHLHLHWTTYQLLSRLTKNKEVISSARFLSRHLPVLFLLQGNGLTLVMMKALRIFQTWAMRMMMMPQWKLMIQVITLVSFHSVDSGRSPRILT